MYLVILGVDIAWNAITETFTEGGGFVSKHLGNPLGFPMDFLEILMDFLNAY